ncbi:MAG: DNA polymerase II large subunit [Methanobacteriota archaeon]
MATGALEGILEEDPAEPDEVAEEDDFKFETSDGPILLQAGESQAMARYFAALEAEMKRAYAVAEACRKKGLDPQTVVEIPPAQDLAARVEKLVGPEGVAERIRVLAKGGMGREEVSLLVAKEVARSTFETNGDKAAAVDQAVRTGLAILTEGILVAPLEGVAKVAVGANADGSEYVTIYFAGPIRAAGGTAQALSVLIADVVRRELGLGRYLVTSAELERYKEELPAYKRAVNLQYSPSPKEIELIVTSCPVCLDGEGTEREEVTGNRDLPRVETNQLRGGMCLVLSDGLISKAAKIAKHVERLKLDGWDFILNFTKSAAKAADAALGDPKSSKNEKFISEIIAGRPVFSHPSAKGGFRLRYGRARTGGLASTAMSPATMVVVDRFLAVGTQMKTEFPGKATVATPCDRVEGPLVLLENGSFVAVSTQEEAERLLPKVREIVDLGELLVPFGEFAENNQPLAAAAYAPEWWEAEVEAKLGRVPLVDTADQAFALAERDGVPLHPRWNLFWHDISVDEIRTLAGVVEQEGTVVEGALRLPATSAARPLLVALGATHDVKGGSIVCDRYGSALVRCLGLGVSGDALVRVRELPASFDGTPSAFVSRLAGVTVRDRAPTRIGARMGRPEKAAERKMSPPVHVLFPIGGDGGMQRLVRDAANKGTITVEVGIRNCPDCRTKTFLNSCRDCGAHTMPSRGGHEEIRIPLRDLLDEARLRLKEDKLPETIKGVQGLISEGKTPEPLEKGILRARHDVTTFKDGTARHDATDVPLTHFTPREIHTSPARLRELGYDKDVHGAPLSRADQVLELRVQDLVVSKSCIEYLFKVSRFTDDLLVRFYGEKPYYGLEKPEDVVGDLVVGLAPHTSGGVLGRVIGWTHALVGFAHPYFHAAKRRNCFHGDTEIVILRKGRLEKTRIKDLVDAAFSSSGANETAPVVRAPQGYEAVSLDPETLSPRRIPVVKAIRVPATEWIEIDSSTHRSFVVTPDHRVLVRRGGILRDLEAAAVVPGDEIPVATSLPRDVRTPTFNVAQELSKLPEARTVRLRSAEAFLRGVAENVGMARAQQAARAGPADVRTPSRWFRSFPVPHFAAWVDAGFTTWDAIPDAAVLGFARDDLTFPTRLPVTPDLCRILGLYLAEGHARSTKTAHQVSWRIADASMGKRLRAALKRVLGRAPIVEESGTKITVASRILYLLLAKVWNAGSGAREKRVPSWCFDLPDPLVAETVAGYFDGDGTVVADPGRLNFYSNNMALLEDVATLLQALGVFTRFAPGAPRPPGRFLAERYRTLGREPPELLDPVHALSLAGTDQKLFAAQITPWHRRKRRRLASLGVGGTTERRLQVGGRVHVAHESAHCLFDRVISVRRYAAGDEKAYCVDVSVPADDIRARNVLLGNGLYQIRCDGDEDCVMLLVDGLVNFSRAYLPKTRGGLMDAPLTLSTRINPSEIDKEAHNVDVSWRYPLAFYEATTRRAHPKEVEKLMDTVGSRLGKPSQYEGLGFTHDTASIEAGPKESAYKTIGSMMDKMNAQLDLASKIRAVDASDVAARVIEHHFLPDLIGNLRAFSGQKIRCSRCNAKYRRVPLSGRCLKCRNPSLTLTVHEKSVRKYLEVSKEVAAKYKVGNYTEQRIALLEEAMKSLFSDDRVKKATLSDFL